MKGWCEGCFPKGFVQTPTSSAHGVSSELQDRPDALSLWVVTQSYVFDC